MIFLSSLYNYNIERIGSQLYYIYDYKNTNIAPYIDDYFKYYETRNKQINVFKKNKNIAVNESKTDESKSSDIAVNESKTDESKTNIAVNKSKSSDIAVNESKTDESKTNIAVNESKTDELPSAVKIKQEGGNINSIWNYFDPDYVGNMINNKLNQQLNIPTATTSNVAKYFTPEPLYTYYIVVDLELVPGDSISINDKKNLACQIQFDNVRKSYADFFGYEFQPSVLNVSKAPTSIETTKKPPSNTTKKNNNSNKKYTRRRR
jgi:hypothetical protein